MNENLKVIIGLVIFTVLIFILGLSFGGLLESYAQLKETKEKYPQSACTLEIEKTEKLGDIPVKCLQYMEFPDQGNNVGSNMYLYE